MFAAIAFGFLSMPCVAWIGVAPTIMVTEAKLSLVCYALWQIPTFGSFILANIVLIKLTYIIPLKKLSNIGLGIAFFGLIITYLLPVMFGEKYIWLMPGIIIYFFGFGFSASPLYRMILYTTNVSKGTASALLSMTYMTIQGLGVEGANLIFVTHNNIHFGAYCAIIGTAFILMMYSNKNLKG